MTAALEAEPPQYTIDELSALAGVPSRTIRFYQSKGALPSPKKRGRKAFYGVPHVERLRLIGELQDRGLQIRAIRNVLCRLDEGGNSVEDLLGLQDQLRKPWTEDVPTLMSEEALRDALRDHQPGLLGALLRRGDVERQGDQYLVQSPALFQQTLELDTVGVDVDAACEAAETLKKHLSKAAAELSRFFVDALRCKLAENNDPERASEMIRTLKSVAPDAARVIFAHEIEGALSELVSEGKV